MTATFESRQGKKKKKKTAHCRRGLLQGYHEYEHWSRRAIITQTGGCTLKDERSGLEPPQPPSSPTYWAQTLHMRGLSSKRPSDNYSQQRDTRSRRLLGESADRERETKRERKKDREAERWRYVPCISPVNVIWSNVWQWAVGLWNVPWLHLHLSLHYIRIFGIVWLLLMQVSSFIHLTLEEETSDNDSLPFYKKTLFSFIAPSPHLSFF